MSRLVASETTDDGTDFGSESVDEESDLLNVIVNVTASVYGFVDARCERGFIFGRLLPDVIEIVNRFTNSGLGRVRAEKILNRFRPILQSVLAAAIRCSAVLFSGLLGQHVREANHQLAFRHAVSVGFFNEST